MVWGDFFFFFFNPIAITNYPSEYGRTEITLKYSSLRGKWTWPCQGNAVPGLGGLVLLHLRLEMGQVTWVAFISSLFSFWGLFYFVYRNINLCLTCTKHSHFLSWFSGFTELAQLWVFFALQDFWKSSCEKGGNCLWVFNCSPLPYHQFLMQKWEEKLSLLFGLSAFWSRLFGMCVQPSLGVRWTTPFLAKAAPVSNTFSCCNLAAPCC